MSGAPTDLKTDKKLFGGKAGPGRPKGLPNKTTTLLKDAIIQAATEAGGKAGLVGYLKTQALDNPNSFNPLLGKVLPLQLTGAGENGEHLHDHAVSLKDAPDEVVAYLAKQRP